MPPGRWRRSTPATEAVLMAWLAAATSPAMARISVTVRVSPATMRAQRLHQLVLRANVPES